MSPQAPALDARLYTVQEIREIEARALAQPSDVTLMQRAGLAAAELAVKLCDNRDLPILVLAGPGNNGGDAYETAWQLSVRGYTVNIIMCGKAENYSSDARSALDKMNNLGLTILDMNDFINNSRQHYSLVIDGLFGIGLKRAPEGDIARLIDVINRLSQEISIPVLALDVPSGLNADTGQLVGTDSVAIRACHTITYIADKPGLHTGSGKDFAGQVSITNLGVPDDFYPKCHTHLSRHSSLLDTLPRRRQNSHKGSFGDVVVLGGARGMAGAAILAARAALYSGAGRTFCSMLAEAPGYDSMHPEIMFRKTNELNLSTATVVIGPGLGMSATAHQLLIRAIQTAKALVIDADGLNLIANDHSLQALLKDRLASCILTPHPLEAARLLNCDIAEVQQDRLSAARELACKLNACIILKGSGSVLSQPDGEVWINSSGNPALASGGTGDVLAGLTAALIAQVNPLFEAARLATWVHGQAADLLVKKGIGPVGMTASELLPEIRAHLNQLGTHQELAG